MKKMEVINTNINNEHKKIVELKKLDNSNDKRKNKPTKAQLFKEERQKIVMELEKLMGLSETNRGVLLYDLEHNEKLKEYLQQIIPQIRKYYKCGTWNYFIQPEEYRDIIGLLKSILKNENYQLINKKKFLDITGVKKLYTQLYIINDEKIKNIFK
jgi:hypothetical protein